MPVFAADLLPDTSGRNLGNPSQRWNAYAQNIDVLGSISYQPVVGAVLRPNGTLFVQTSPVTAAVNTTAAQNLASCIIPAGLLNVAGRVLRGTMGGSFVTQSGQTPQINVAAYLANIQVSLLVTGILSAGQSNNCWRMQWELIVYVAGTAAQVDPHSAGFYQPDKTSDIGTAVIWNMPQSGPLDLTVAQPLSCQCNFNTNTSPANSITQREFVVEILN